MYLFFTLKVLLSTEQRTIILLNSSQDLIVCEIQGLGPDLSSLLFCRHKRGWPARWPHAPSRRLTQKSRPARTEGGQGGLHSTTGAHPKGLEL